MLQIPILRNGNPYKSLTYEKLFDHRTGKVVAQVSQANTGLIEKDIRTSKGVWHDLQRDMSISEALDLCHKAAEIFLSKTIDLNGVPQSPQDFLEVQCATTGMPKNLCRKNMEKIHWVLSALDSILTSLARGVSWEIIEKGYGSHHGAMISFLPQARHLGAVLPSNSPGVHSLWLPALALRTPVVLRPGSREPWTPLRLCYAFMEAGYPKEAFSFYPSSYQGGTSILLHCERSMIFGDDNTVKPWLNDSRVEIHGTGNSKIVLGEDLVEEWEEYLDLMVHSIAENGGRSCINASSVWTPKYGKEIADALGQRLAKIVPKALDDEKASLAAFSDPRVARAIDQSIEQGLSVDSCEYTALYRVGERVIECEGSTFLQPTIVWCDNLDHPLANKEFLFPYASVLEIPAQKITQVMPRSLVVTAITEDPRFERELICCPQIERLNIGKISTCQVDWEQPHEGNLFEFLYLRRSFQKCKTLKR